MKMQKGLKILLILLLAGIIIPDYSYGEIIFEDSFENYGNWSDLPPKKWTQRRVGVSIKAGS